jgi:hypothetical protein
MKHFWRNLREEFWGLWELLESFSIPEHTDYAKTMDWLGRRFNTEIFCSGKISLKLIGME